MIGILFMLYGPTSSSVLRVRTTSPASGPTLGVSFAPPPPLAYTGPPTTFVFEPAAPSPPPFVPAAHSLSTDFSVEEPVREVRIRAKSPSPPPLPPVTPLLPPPLPKAAQTMLPAAPTMVPLALPKAAQMIAPAPIIHAQASAPVRAEGTPTTPPRLGVSAPSARARHLEPPRRMPPPMPRSRSARGSDGPPLSAFATDQQRTAPRDLDELSTAEHTFVD